MTTSAPELNVTAACASLPKRPVWCWVSPTFAIASLLDTAVMSGPPSAAAPMVKLTVVVAPVPNGSPDQPPGPGR